MIAVLFVALIQQVAVPMLVLHADDDPLVDPDDFPQEVRKYRKF